MTITARGVAFGALALAIAATVAEPLIRGAAWVVVVWLAILGLLP